MSNSKENSPVVLQVLPELEMGGVERGTVEIATYMQQHGIKNFVASQGGRMVYDLEKAKVPHLTLKSKNIFKMRANAKKLEQFIRDNGINIVHARSRAPAWSAYWATKRAGVHFMTTFHGTYGLGPWGIKKLYNRIMTYGERVIAISEHIKKHILGNYKIAEGKIRLVHRCVDIEKFNPDTVSQERIIKTVKEYNIPEDKPVLLLIGRLTNWKGQHLLIEALSLLKHKDFYCLIVGPDQGRVKYSEYLRELVKKYHLEGSVAFYGQTSDVSALMMVSNVVLSTAIEPEAFGRISIEGQAMGKVVVASNIGGSLDTITDGVTGKFFYSNNPASLAEAIDWALDLSPIMCEKTVAVYKELLNNQ